MDNKFVWAIAAFILGYYIAKRRIGGDIDKKIAEAEGKITAEFAAGVDNALAIAESKGMTVSQVRQNWG